MPSATKIIVTLLVSFSHLTIGSLPANEKAGRELVNDTSQIEDRIRNQTRLLQEVLVIIPKMTTILTEFAVCAKSESTHRGDDTLRRTCYSTASECLMNINQTESALRKWIDGEPVGTVRRLPEDGEVETRVKVEEIQKRLMRMALDSMICTCSVTKNFIQLCDDPSRDPHINVDIRVLTEASTLLPEVNQISLELIAYTERQDSEKSNRVTQLKKTADFMKWVDKGGVQMD